MKLNRRTFTRKTSKIMCTGALAMNHPQMLIAAESTPKKIRMGVVGGGFGRSFFWHLHPHSTVTAVCDLRDDRLKILSDTYQCSIQYKNFHDLIRDKNVDAIAIFTPVPLHTYMAVKAMEAGKHVLSAVPCSASLEECEQLIEAVERTGMTYMMAETSYYRYQIIQCRRWAAEGKFGTIFYSESEYHHEGLIGLMYDEKGFPTWRHGFVPMHYPTHCLGCIIPVTGERMTEVTCTGWGDGHEVLQTNLYENPFWNETAMFKTSGGHTCRVNVFWHVADGVVERASFYGDKMSYMMARPGDVPGLVAHPAPHIRVEPFETPHFWDELPKPLRRPSGHGGSHTWITHEFITALCEERKPDIDIYEAVAYTAPGFYAHQSALQGGSSLKIKNFDKAKG